MNGRTESTPLKESTMIEIEPIHPLEIPEIVNLISTHLSYYTNEGYIGDLVNLRLTSSNLNNLVENTPAGKIARQVFNAEYYGNIVSYTWNAIISGAFAGATSGLTSPFFSGGATILSSLSCKALRCSMIAGGVGGGFAGGVTGSWLSELLTGRFAGGYKNKFTGLMASLTSITVGSGIGAGVGLLANTETFSKWASALIWVATIPTGGLTGGLTGALLTGTTVGLASCLGMFAKQKNQSTNDIRTKLTKPIALEESVNVTPKF